MIFLYTINNNISITEVARHTHDLKHKIRIQLKMRSNIWNKDRKLLVDILALLLGINAYISVTPIFSQLPLLVHTAPERWITD